MVRPSDVSLRSTFERLLGVKSAAASTPWEVSESAGIPRGARKEALLCLDELIAAFRHFRHHT